MAHAYSPNTGDKDRRGLAASHHSQARNSRFRSCHNKQISHLILSQVWVHIAIQGSYHACCFMTRFHLFSTYPLLCVQHISFKWSLGMVLTFEKNYLGDITSSFRMLPQRRHRKQTAAPTTWLLCVTGWSCVLLFASRPWVCVVMVQQPLLLRGR